MKIEVTDATTLPTWMQPLVADGHLDLGAMAAPEDVTGLKTALSKERGNAAAWSRFGTPAEMDAKIADLTEKAKGTGKTSDDAQAVLDAMQAKHDGEMGAKDKTIDGMRTRGAASEFEAELARAGFKPSITAKIAQFNMDRIAFNDDGTAKILTSDGTPMIGSGKNHGATYADLAKEMAASPGNSDFVLDAGKGGGGKPAGSDGGKPDKPTTTWATFNEMSQSARMEFSKSGGKVKD